VLPETDFLFLNFFLRFKPVAYIETRYLNADMYKFESSPRLIPRRLKPGVSNWFSLRAKLTLWLPSKGQL